MKSLKKEYKINTKWNNNVRSIYINVQKLKVFKKRIKDSDCLSIIDILIYLFEHNQLNLHTCSEADEVENNEYNQFNGDSCMNFKFAGAWSVFIISNLIISVYQFY